MMYAVSRHSTVRMIIDAIEAFQAKGHSLDYYEWDGHAESFELPEYDLIGLVGFSCTQNDQFHDITFGIAVMTYQDPDLSRATDYLDFFYQKLQAHKKYPVYHLDGTLTNFEIVAFDGTSVSPMGQVNARPAADIQISARVTRAGQYQAE